MEELLKGSWRCAQCGKELDNDMYKGLFCSDECYKQFINEFDKLIDSLDTEITEELLKIDSE